MSIPLTQVTMNFVDPSGVPIQGVVVTAELSAPMIYQEIIVPVKETATTDHNGYGQMSLVPSNLLATTGYSYTFTIKIPGYPVPLIYYEIAVPNSGQVTLQYLLGWDSASGAPGYISWSANNYWTANVHWSAPVTP